MRESLKYLVVGDTIIDEDVYCKAAGLSLESPTLKTTYNMRRVNYGGAAKDKPTGYFSHLSSAIHKISRLGLANQKEEYTLAGFIESFNNIKNKLTNSIKN